MTICDNLSLASGADVSEDDDSDDCDTIDIAMTTCHNNIPPLHIATPDQDVTQQLLLHSIQHWKTAFCRAY